jgi:hypothetical protein
MGTCQIAYSVKEEDDDEEGEEEEKHAARQAGDKAISSSTLFSR